MDALVGLAKLLHLSLEALMFDGGERDSSGDLARQFEAVSQMPERRNATSGRLRGGQAAYCGVGFGGGGQPSALAAALRRHGADLVVEGVVGRSAVLAQIAEIVLRGRGRSPNARG